MQVHNTAGTNSVKSGGIKTKETTKIPKNGVRSCVCRFFYVILRTHPLYGSAKQ